MLASTPRETPAWVVWGIYALIRSALWLLNACPIPATPALQIGTWDWQRKNPSIPLSPERSPRSSVMLKKKKKLNSIHWNLSVIRGQYSGTLIKAITIELDFSPQLKNNPNTRKSMIVSREEGWERMKFLHQITSSVYC